ncbi:MAG: DUF3854 domain-containing protein [Symploca sp. SIO2E6]|nr:DUF3854 domain-containing protein [Symploca sp. SIO2E6]
MQNLKPDTDVLSYASGTSIENIENQKSESIAWQRLELLSQLPGDFWHELIIGSAIDPGIANLNCRRIEGDEVYSTLLYAKPQSEIRRNDGRLRDKWLKKYSQIADDGALYFNGLDPHRNWEQDSDWGRLKPRTPRIGWDGKAHKYESPVKPASYHPLYFRVNNEISEKVSRRYGVAIPDGASNFWQWIQQNPEIPVILAEGEKKAQCLLSLGFAAVALPGIWCGRVNSLIPGIEQLHPDLVPIAKGRKFLILFDYEEKQKTRWQVFRATQRTGKCIEDAGGKCEVAMLKGPQKGVDDWVVSLEDKAEHYLEGLLQDSLSLKEHREMHFFTSRELKKYKPDVVVNSKRLADVIKLPLSGTVVIKSDVGTGKTFLVQKLREKHPSVRFLNNGHRISLLRNLSKRLKTELYSKLNSRDYGSVLALSITADSLWKLANNLEKYGFVFIDEAAQYLWHLLNSKTLKERRHEILQVLEFVVRNAQLLILADAHISDEVVEFFMNMRPEGEQPFIINNKWGAGGRNVFWYEGKNYSALYAETEGLIEQGKKLYFCSNSKSAIKKMERDLLKRFPKLETEIRAIHGENSGSPENVAFLENINDLIGEVFVLLCSPSLSTGVDISTEHFDAIIGIFYGLNQTAEDCIQQLWRIRPNIPMHVWVASHPSFGYRETNHRKIREDILSNNRNNSIILKIDPNTGEKGAEKEWQLDIYCRLKAKRNRSINNLRQDLKLLLQSMGNEIIPMGSSEDKGIYKRLKIARDEIDEAHYLQVSNSADISFSVYLNRKNQDYLSPEELLECEKFRIKDFYGKEVTPELVRMDDGGRLAPKILEFEGAISAPGEPIIKDGQEIPSAPPILARKDSSDRENYPFSWDWGNRSLRWFARERLGFHALLRRLRQGEEYSSLDEDVQQLAQLAKQNSASIKSVLGFLIREEDSPNKIVGMLLQQLGLSSQSRQERAGGKRIRKYSLISDDVIFNQEVCDYRRLKREERERKLRQEQEDNERHRRALQFRYGIGEPQSKASQGLHPRHTPPPIRDGDYNEAGCVSAPQCTNNSELVTQEQLQRLKGIASQSAENKSKLRDWVFWEFLLERIDQLKQYQYWQIIEDFAGAAI